MLNNDAHFIFDSNHIEDIQSRLYGFYTTEKGIFTHTLPSEDIANATGIWIRVKRLEHSIDISQDHIGSFGLFLYQKDNYWALSNSFNHLLDFLKQDHSLHLNDEYAQTYLAQQLCISAYGQTIIKEIQWLDRRALVQINIEDSSLDISYHALNERKVECDSQQGIELLDAWHDKWAGFINRAQEFWPGRIQVDVSGGMDTRMVLAPVLSSGVSFDRIVFNSHEKREEDYKIACEIADIFGFELNKNKDFDAFESYYPVEPFYERALWTILFEKETYTPNIERSVTPVAAFSGSSGGMIRNYHSNLTCSQYTEVVKRRIPKRLAKNKKVIKNIESLLEQSYQAIHSMLVQVEKRNPDESLNGFEFYLETRNRSHFGISNARGSLSQFYSQSILTDPLLMQLKTPKQYPDLIPTLIFTRYHSALASVPIEGNRSLNKETLLYAKQLNEMYKRTTHSFQVKDNENKDIHYSFMKPDCQCRTKMENAKQIKPIKEQLEQAYQSTLVQRLFKKHFGHSPNIWISSKKKNLHPKSNQYAIVAISKVLLDIQKGKDAPKDFEAFLKLCQKEKPNILNRFLKKGLV